MNVFRCLMIVAMDLNASPVPEEEDEDVYEEKIHVQEYSAPDDHVESGAAIARRVLFLVSFFFFWCQSVWISSLFVAYGTSAY